MTTGTYPFTSELAANHGLQVGRERSASTGAPTHSVLHVKAILQLTPEGGRETV